MRAGTTDLTSRARRRRAAELAAAAAAIAALILPAAAIARPHGALGPAKPGCWLAKGHFSGSYVSGPVKAKVTSGTIDMRLWVGKGGELVGLLSTGGVGNGTLSMSGSKLKLTVLITGTFDVTGSPAAMKVNGAYRWKGTAKGSGVFGGAGAIPVDLKLPVKNQPLTVVSATPTRMVLRFGNATFTALKVKTLTGPVGKLCSGKGASQ